jgi:hypothetical protein
MVGGLEIYQGIYLGKEKVTIKVINNANSGPNTARVSPVIMTPCIG